MKLAVIGSREITDYDKVAPAIDKFIDKHVVAYSTNYYYCIISGGAVGVDTLAKRYCKEYDIDYIEFLPYFKIGPRAYSVDDYFVRNEQIIKNSDAVLVIWDGKSSSINNARLAERWGKITEVVTIEN